MEAIYTALFALLGLAVGSFLNVCIDRLPGGRSVVTPPSQCDSCHRRLAAIDLIPVLSYLWLRGRCRYCQASIPQRIVWVELASGALLAFLYQLYGWTPELGITAFWAVVFILVFVIDLEQGLILNKVVYPSMVVALLFAGFLDPPWMQMERWSLSPIVSSAVGGAVGFVMFWLIAVLSAYFLRNRREVPAPEPPLERGSEGMEYGGSSGKNTENRQDDRCLDTGNVQEPIQEDDDSSETIGGMGWGDVKLAGLIGLVCGFPLVLLAVVFGAVLGLAGGVLFMARKRRWVSGQTIPFGTSLAVATMFTILWGEHISNWYMRLL